jgi:hypothetical protein
MCVLALGVMGCGEGGGAPPDDSPYASKDLWLCRPDIENDRCDTADLSTTEIRPDGTMATSEIALSPNAEVDCFYVYSTVDDSPEPGNTETLFPHPEKVIQVVSFQGAHFRGVCRMFAPLYHQMTSSTYAEFPFALEETEFFQRAYDDVVEAFEYYMRAHNKGRGFVLVGHSQGSGMLAKLLEDKFDNDGALRGQLVSALLGGLGGRVQVPTGKLVGGTFANIPLCTSASETGCVISFNAFAAGTSRASPFVPPGMVQACVNPASFDDGPRALAALIYPRSETRLPFPDTVETEWVSYPKIYESQCSDDTGGLEVDLVGNDPREEPFTPHELQEGIVEAGGGESLHWVEPFLTVRDLVRLVETQSANR